MRPCPICGFLICRCSPSGAFTDEEFVPPPAGKRRACADIEARLASALAALDEVKAFTRHDGLCGIIGGYGYCTCGLEAAIARIDGLE